MVYVSLVPKESKAQDLLQAIAPAAYLLIWMHSGLHNLAKQP